MSTTPIPVAPSFLPKAEQAKWQKTYEDALKQAESDFPDDASTQKQAAMREANRALRTPKLTSYEDAMKLAEWQVIKRREVVLEAREGDFARGDRVLKVTTIDGKKGTFAVPDVPAAPESKSDDKKPLSKMTKDELVAYAKEIGIPIPEGNKDAVFDALQKQLKG